ncbi:hypothetical protein GWN26_09090 [Candidatus Saccharibacteria bacterium]|nr:hypothetical protein [Candidatus Saccharibacteria bacterium]NIV72292.1 hypothetical protein [Calditrichia bacterium]NIV99274.1 hypothetical protein [Candidatus Saccharibacteria bacterium]
MEYFGVEEDFLDGSNYNSPRFHPKESRKIKHAVSQILGGKAFVGSALMVSGSGKHEKVLWTGKRLTEDTHPHETKILWLGKRISSP